MKLSAYPGYNLHQIGPYLGKTRPVLARRLVESYTKAGDWIWDPFCGSGTIALESKLLNRNIIAGDINLYACYLTRSKLFAPSDSHYDLSVLEFLGEMIHKGIKKPDRNVPLWVRKFFHPKTLRETIFIFSELMRRRNYFLLGCILGILHHQRPGFLSYPASHLIPYLRSNSFPRDKYPEVYAYRDPIVRLQSKVERVLKSNTPKVKCNFRVERKSILSDYIKPGTVDAVITSPPYMDNLDYARDNRLRLWFLGVSDYMMIKGKEIGAAGSFDDDIFRSLVKVSRSLKQKGIFTLILGDVKRNSKTIDLPNRILNLIKNNFNEFKIVERWSEIIPYERRSLRYSSGTKEETILVFQKK